MNLSRSSSRPLSRITKAIGIKSPKNIIPSTIGLTIIPSRCPKCIHSLFSGNRISALTAEIIKNDKDDKPNAYDHDADVALYKYAEATAKTKVKKNPNFRLEGS